MGMNSAPKPRPTMAMFNLRSLIMRQNDESGCARQCFSQSNFNGNSGLRPLERNAVNGKVQDRFGCDVGQERGRLVRVLGTAQDSRGRGVRAPDDIALDRQFLRLASGAILWAIWALFRWRPNHIEPPHPGPLFQRRRGRRLGQLRWRHGAGRDLFNPRL